MDKDVIHQGWLEFSTEFSNSKSWLKISTKKTWKRRFLVLYKVVEDSDKLFLCAYDKEDWNKMEPKKKLFLFPTYKIAKLFNIKHKEHVLEVSNNVEKWCLSAEKGKILDLWATQIQMQMKLSRVISGRIFSVSGSVSKPLQKIGAAQERCLLHITKWGVTLALQDSRSILALWPLKTIRNYEYTGNCQFTIESGRRSPMGEGVYLFYTNIGQDEEIFNLIDAFIATSLREKAELLPNKKAHISDEEILQYYDELHKSALGLNSVNPLQSYDRITHTTSNIPFQSRELSLRKPPDYNYLFNDNRKNTIPNGSNTTDSYDQLDRINDLKINSDVVDLPEKSYDALSTNRKTLNVDTNYDHIGAAVRNNLLEDRNCYDHIDGNGNEKSSSLNAPLCSPKLFPLRDEPSIPFLDDNEIPFVGRSPLCSVSSNRSDKYEFRNSIYTPATSETGLNVAGSFSSTQDLISLKSRNSSNASDFSRHGSNASDRFAVSRNITARGSSLKDKSIHDIADHFMYQVPCISPTTDTFQHANQTFEEEEEIEGTLYQNRSCAYTQ